MTPTAIGVLVWMVAAPAFLMLWLLSRRKFNKLTADSLNRPLKKSAVQNGFLPAQLSGFGFGRLGAESMPV